MKKNYIVIGLGRFGINLVRELIALKREVLAIDKSKEAVEFIGQFTSDCAVADASRIKALEELDVRAIDHAIVAIGGNLQDTILTVINLKQLGVKNITVRIDTEELRDVMLKVGATEVIIPEVASAIGLANQLLSDSIVDYYKVNSDFGMATVVVGEEFKEQTVQQLDTRKKYDINILGIQRGDKFFIPKPDDVILKKDMLTVFGNDKKIVKFDSAVNK